MIVSCGCVITSLLGLGNDTSCGKMAKRARRTAVSTERAGRLAARVCPIEPELPHGPGSQSRERASLFADAFLTATPRSDSLSFRHLLLAATLVYSLAAGEGDWPERIYCSRDASPD